MHGFLLMSGSLCVWCDGSSLRGRTAFTSTVEWEVSTWQEGKENHLQDPCAPQSLNVSQWSPWMARPDFGSGCSDSLPAELVSALEK